MNEEGLRAALNEANMRVGELYVYSARLEAEVIDLQAMVAMSAGEAEREADEAERGE